jgi:hypothetical protein
MQLPTRLLWLLLASACGCSYHETNIPSGTSTPVSAWPTNWSSLLGQTVTVEGTAEALKVGPYLVSNGQGGIWIDGLDSWPAECFSGDQGKRLRVTGTVIQKDDLPVFVLKPGELVPAGIPVRSEEEREKAKWRFLLTRAKWTVLD